MQDTAGSALAAMKPSVSNEVVDGDSGAADQTATYDAMEAFWKEAEREKKRAQDEAQEARSQASTAKAAAAQAEREKKRAEDRYRSSSSSVRSRISAVSWTSMELPVTTR